MIKRGWTLEHLIELPDPSAACLKLLYNLAACFWGSWPYLCKSKCFYVCLSLRNAALLLVTRKAGHCCEDDWTGSAEASSFLTLTCWNSWPKLMLPSWRKLSYWYVTCLDIQVNVALLPRAPAFVPVESSQSTNQPSHWWRCWRGWCARSMAASPRPNGIMILMIADKPWGFWAISSPWSMQCGIYCILLFLILEVAHKALLLRPLQRCESRPSCS